MTGIEWFQWAMTGVLSFMAGWFLFAAFDVADLPRVFRLIPITLFVLCVVLVVSVWTAL